MTRLRWKSTTPTEKKSTIATTGTWRGDVVEWSDFSDSTAILTQREVEAVRQKHGTKTVKEDRATMVKKLLGEGRSVRAIHKALGPLGRGYSLRTLTKDCAALSAGEGLKKRRTRSKNGTATLQKKPII